MLMVYKAIGTGHLDNDKRSVLGVDRRSRTSEQKITSGRSPFYLSTFITLLM